MLKWDAAMEVRAVPPPFACPEAGYPSSPLNLKCTEACIQAELTAPQVT